MHVFLFDIDGTLISSGGAGQAAIREAMVSEFGVVDPESVPVHGLTDRVIASSLFERHEIEDSPENWRRFINAYLNALPGLLAAKNGTVLPGVVELLNALAMRDDVAIGLLTGNVPRGAQIKLEFYGLNHHFAFGGFGEDHRRREDVATAALAAARGHLNGKVSLDRTYVVGDTPNDIRCSRHIGARVVAVCTGIFGEVELAEEKPDLLLQDLSTPFPVLQLMVD